MNSLPWFPMFAKDWLVSTMEMSNEEKGAYIDLLCMQWENGYVSRVPSRYASEWGVLKSKFKSVGDGKFVNERLHEIRLEKEDILEKQQLGGKKGAKKRYGSPDRIPSGYSESESELEEEPKKEKKKSAPKPYKTRVDDFFQSIEASDLEVFKEAYPNVDLDIEIRKAKAWLISNPGNAKKDFMKFLNNWLARAMDKSKPDPMSAFRD